MAMYERDRGEMPCAESARVKIKPFTPKKMLIYYERQQGRGACARTQVFGALD